MTGVDSKTIRRIGREIIGTETNPRGVATSCEGWESGLSGEQNPPLRPPTRAAKLARSACEAHRAWIEERMALGRNAQAVYQDLVERFVRGSTPSLGG